MIVIMDIMACPDRKVIEGRSVRSRREPRTIHSVDSLPGRYQIFSFLADFFFFTGGGASAAAAASSASLARRNARRRAVLARLAAALFS
jgi:hypothetical protein